MKWGSVFALVVISILMSGCSTPPAGNIAEMASSGKLGQAGSPEAEKFLRWSMNQYAALKSYRSDVKWSLDVDGKPKLSEARSIAFAVPNKFKILTADSNGNKVGSISNGESMIEFAEGPSGGARQLDPPTTLAVVDSRQMTQPVLNGSLLYQFFGGSDNFDGLVDSSKGGVKFGDVAKAPNGEDAKVVTFYANGGYGNVKVTIGAKSGFVYGLAFDGDGIREGIRQRAQSDQEKNSVPALAGKETFANIETNKEIPSSTFDPTPPKGVKVLEAASNEQKAPVPVGKPVPSFELTRIDGTNVTLASMKGKIVMIDFWATWCPPCRESLPITNRIAQQFGGKGVEVMTVSAEEQATVADFVKQNNYTFPAYLDAGGRVSAAFNVRAIPCLVIIDAKGNLSSYSVGLQPESKVMLDLKRAGLKT